MPEVPPLPSNPAENDGPRIIGATLTIVLLGVLASLLRFYVRLFVVRNFGLDVSVHWSGLQLRAETAAYFAQDVFMVAATLLIVVEEALVIASVRYGAGRHMGDIPPEDIPMGIKLNYITQPLYLFGIYFVKMAVGSMLLRIASVPIYKRLIIGIMVFMTFYTIGCFFVRARNILGAEKMHRPLTWFLRRQSSSSAAIPASSGTHRSKLLAGRRRSCRVFPTPTSPATS